jgi:hypothetical protein
MQRWAEYTRIRNGDAATGEGSDFYLVWYASRGGSGLLLSMSISATALIHDLTVVTRNTDHFAPTGVRLKSGISWHPFKLRECDLQCISNHGSPVSSTAVCGILLSMSFEHHDLRAGRHHLFGLITNYSWYRQISRSNQILVTRRQEIQVSKPLIPFSRTSCVFSIQINIKQ